MMAGMEKAMQIGASLQSDAQRGQMVLFGGDGFGGGHDYSSDHDTLPKVQPWTEMQMLTYEKDVLGFYVTMNPLSKYADTIGVYSNANTSELGSRKEGQEVVIGGMVTKIRHIVTKRGKNAGAKMAVFTLEDLQGNCEVVMFPKVLEKFDAVLGVDKILFVCGKVDCKREVPNVICDELIPIDQVGDKLSARVWIQLKSEDVSEEKMSQIRSLCAKHKGKAGVYVSVTTQTGYRICAVADKKLSVRPDVEFCRKLESVVGPGKVELGRR